MVKILQAYNFAKQNTFSLNSEILAATLLESNRIAVCSAEQFIEIYDISSKERPSEIIHAGAEKLNVIAYGERVPSKYSLPTVGEVVDLIYCRTGKYLLTLEKENVSSPVTSHSTGINCTSSSNSHTVFSEDDKKMFVRVYSNFSKFPEEQLIDLPITVRIASMTTPKTPLTESIDVLELPLRSSPDLIQCCQVSGNVIISSKDRIYLYEYTQCLHDNTQPRFSYIDFLPFKFFVHLNFTPSKLNIAENVIACLNSRFCVAFKVIDTSSQTLPIDAKVLINNNSDEAAVKVEANKTPSSSGTSIITKLSHNSFESDSLETTSSSRAHGAVGMVGRLPVDFNIARIANSACGRDFEVDIKSQWEQCEHSNSCAIGEAQDIVIAPARANDIKIKLVNEAKVMNVQRISSTSNGEDTIVQYDVRKLLQICMKTSEPNGRIVEILRCMDLKAIYEYNGSHQHYDEQYIESKREIYTASLTTKSTHRRTLKSHAYQRCVGYALLVASSVDGYLYQFCAQGKWYNENEKPIATYSFTAPVLQVSINDYVIFAITNESVETHTSRIGHKLFNNRFEYPSTGSLFPEESSPDVNSRNAVIGLCSFMNVQFVCVSRYNVVLITNHDLGMSSHSNDGNTVGKKQMGQDTKRGIALRLLAEAKAKHLLRGASTQQSVVNEWTLYNLEIPRIDYVIEDIETIAETYRSASSVDFFDIMEEAHVILRLSLFLQTEVSCVDQQELLRTKFTENCRKLADFSIRSNKKDVYSQATGFYKMCNLSLAKIYENYINNLVVLDNAKTPVVSNTNSDVNHDEIVGLIHTVKLFLLSLGADRLAASFLNQLVKPFFTPNRVIQQGHPLVPMALEFLNMFIKYSPSDIPQIMLNSPVVTDSISGELINYLRYLDNLSPDENLLLAITASRISNYILSHEIISQTSRRDLAVALMKNPKVLFDDSTVLFWSKQYNDSVQQRDARGHRKQQFNLTENHEINKLQTPIISFSDFTETILLATENIELIEGISDAFIHALCIEHTLTLDMVLQLFLNYIASHIGQKGYQTSQRVLVNILQVYYYILFDMNHSNNADELALNTPPPVDEHDKKVIYNSEQDESAKSSSESDSVSNSVATEERCIPIKNPRIICGKHSEAENVSHSKALSNYTEENNFTSDKEINLKGFKILFRMYLGRLKALSDLLVDFQSADDEQQVVNEQGLDLRVECINIMTHHLQELRVKQQQQKDANGYNGSYYAGKQASHTESNNGENKIVFVPFIPDYKLTGEAFLNHVRSYIRPIPCLLGRPQYLNRLPPFKRNDFSVPNSGEGEFTVRFLSWDNELLTQVLKMQSLLAFQKIDCNVVEEFITFVQKCPDLIGIDSFLVIILPKNLAINYMLNLCPEQLWYYGKSNSFTPKQWEPLLRKILGKKKILPRWRSYVTEILNNLVAELSFEELLQCFPSALIRSQDTGSLHMEASANQIMIEKIKFSFTPTKEKANNDCQLKRNHFPMDNIDESNVFEIILRQAVSKQRSCALRSMIESTGTQLFDATNNTMYNL